MNLVKKLLLPLTIIVMLAGCTSEAEKEKNDADIINNKILELEQNTREEVAQILNNIIYETSDISVEIIDEATNKVKERINTYNEQVKSEYKNLKSDAGKKIVDNQIQFFKISEDVFLQILSYLKNYVDTPDVKLDKKASELLESKLADKIEELDKLYDETTTLLKELNKRVHTNSKETETK